MAHSMNNAFLNDRNAAFRPPGIREGANAALAGVTTGLNDTDKYFVLPPGNKDNRTDKEAWALFLMLVGKSDLSIRVKWRSWILSWTSLCFPSITESFTGRATATYEAVVLTTSQIQKLQSIYRLYKAIGSDGADKEEFDDEFKEIMSHDSEESTTESAFPLLPSIKTPDFIGDLQGSVEIEGIYGYYSLILFLAGKNINDANRQGITTRRPLAIERKYSMVGTPSLTGPLQMGNTAHEQVNAAFTAMTVARKAIFEKVAHFSSATGNRSIEVVATTTRLMHYSGMSHVLIIDTFLSSFPHAEKAPVLQGALSYYHSSLNALIATQPVYRPFFKLMHGDTVRVFNRKDVESLIAISVSRLKTTQPTLLQYNVPETTTEIEAQFRRFEATIMGQDVNEAAVD